MRKLSLKSVKDELSDRVLSESEMSELLGGAGTLNPSGIWDQELRYYCSAKVNGFDIVVLIWSTSASQAAVDFKKQYEESGGPGVMTDVSCMLDGNGYGYEY